MNVITSNDLKPLLKVEWQNKLANEFNESYFIDIIEAIKRTNQFKDKKWGSNVEKPSLLLNATQDRLVSPSGNVQILSRFKNSHAENIDSRHEIFMESDQIRNQAWKKVDEFLANL